MMTVIRNKEIDLSNYKPKDLIITDIRGMIGIQVDEGITVVVNGIYSNSTEDNAYPLAVINTKDLTISSSITTGGIYTVVSEGIDRIELKVTGTTGRIFWKELGD